MTLKEGLGKFSSDISQISGPIQTVNHDKPEDNRVMKLANDPLQ